MTEPVQHPMNPEQEIRLHAINLATALRKDTVRLTAGDGVRGLVGEYVVQDAAMFAAFIETGAVPVSGIQESETAR
jgi:hypothetical protein